MCYIHHTLCRFMYLARMVKHGDVMKSNVS
jgi:hypothetical protein